MCGLVMADSEMGCGPERLLMGLGQEREGGKQCPAPHPLCDAGRHECGGQRTPASLQSRFRAHSRLAPGELGCRRVRMELGCQGGMKDLWHWEDRCIPPDHLPCSKPH